MVSRRVPIWLLLLACGLVAGGSAPALATLGATAAHHRFDRLFGVAATSPGNAWAVGYRSRFSCCPEFPLIEHWNGTAWRQVSSPAVRGAVTSQLLDVAATSRRDAWAVGDFAKGRIHTLIEHWGGRSWRRVPSPSPGTHADWLNAVAAASPSDAWAVGSENTGQGSGSHTLIEHWDGTAWRQVPSPDGAQASAQTQVQNILSDVAVISPSNAWAVGTFIVGSSPVQTLIEHWNGVQWSVVPSPNPDVNVDHLGGVAAITSGDVLAVGDFGDVFAPTRTLVAQWNGSKWRVVRSPNLTVDFPDSLGAVAATSASNAWAVGTADTNSSELSQILHWDGSRWRMVRSPNPAAVGLADVAAISARVAWAVGTVGAGRILIEQWNGTRWVIVPSPNP